MSWAPIWVIALGTATLILGSEVLLRGALRLAVAGGISPLVIGLTLVAFGTSSPELAVSIFAGFRDDPDIALGNVIGSNIFNILFILGIAAMVAPLLVSPDMRRQHLPLMIAASLLTWGLALDGRFGRLDGLLLFSGIVLFTVYAIRTGRTAAEHTIGTTGPPLSDAQVRPPAPRRRALRTLLDAAATLAGLALLVLGSRWLVTGASELARAMGVSELVIGLTIVAGGTSLPEVATSVMAAARGHREIAVGNVIGSNIFNLLGILGVTAIVAPRGIAVAGSALTTDIPIMVLTAVVCFPVFSTGRRVGRLEGALFLAGYVIYVLALIR